MLNTKSTLGKITTDQSEVARVVTTGAGGTIWRCGGWQVPVGGEAMLTNKHIWCLFAFLMGVTYENKF